MLTCLFASLGMSARVLYDSFVSDPLHVSIQPLVFQSWLRGLTAAELVADLPAQLHRRFHLHQPASSQQRRHILRKRRHKRPSLSSSSSSSSSPSSPSSLPHRVLSSPVTGSPNISRRPSAAATDDRTDAAVPHTIIHQLAALHIPATAATAVTTTSPAIAAAAADDSPQSVASSSSDSDSSDDELHQTAAALSSAAYNRLLTAAQHSIHSQYRVLSMLSHYFHTPHLLASPSPPLQLAAASISALLASYYSFHPPLLRELCGVKLKALARGEVDVLGMRVGVRPISAWRMLENVRRLYRVRWPERDEEREEEPAGGPGGVAGGNLSRNASLRWRQMRSAVGKMRVSGGKAGAAGDDADEVDDYLGGGGAGLSTTALLSELFYLPVPLARSYTQLIFLCRHRIQSDSKRLIGVGWEDMMLIAHWLMERWTVRAADEDPTQRLNRHSSAPTLHKQSSASKSDRGDDGSITSITPLPSPALAAGTFTQSVPSPPFALSSPYPSTAPNMPYGIFLSSLNSASPLLAGTAPLPASPSATPALSSTASAMLGGVDEVGDSLDMDFIAELRTVKVHIADNRRLMDEYITAILGAIREYNMPAPSSPPTTPTASSAPSRSLLYEKLKGRGVGVYVRALMGLAVPLGKPKRHRQLLLALVDDVVRLGVKGGLAGEEMAVMLECVSRGWEAVGEVRLKVNVMRERQREGLTVGAASSAGGGTVYNDEVARCYLNWLRFLSAVVPITALLYRRMRPLN